MPRRWASVSKSMLPHLKFARSLYKPKPPRAVPRGAGRRGGDNRPGTKIGSRGFFVLKLSPSTNHETRAPVGSPNVKHLGAASIGGLAAKRFFMEDIYRGVEGGRFPPSGSSANRSMSGPISSVTAMR